MNQRKYELENAYLKGELTVIDLIDRIIELEEPLRRKECLENIKHTYTIKEYIIENRVDAATILESMVQLAGIYGTVKVADYYELLGEEVIYVDNEYGWTADSLKQASIVPFQRKTYYRNGYNSEAVIAYTIKFPPVEVL